MALPDLNEFCIKLFPGGQLCVTFPGGATLCAVFPDAKVPALDELTNALLGNINSALAPLAPLFDLIDLLVAIINCVKAVEKCLGPPPDPTELVKCFPNLAKALAKVLKLIPQLSIPVLIGGILDVIIVNLQGLRAQILTIINKQLRIIRAQTRAVALGSVQLMTSVDCATDDLTAFLNNLNANSAPLGRLINLLNAFLDLCGLPHLPTVNDLGADAAAALAPLDDAIKALQLVRKGFP